MVIILRNNKYAPAAIVLMVLGIIIVLVQHNFPSNFRFGITLPPLTWFSPTEIWKGMVLAGFAQIALSATNAVIATSALISEYFPDKPVSERKLAFNMGVMNIVTPFFGGMPMCHGAGGLAGQYYFGARTGGTNIIEGIIEICMGLFLAGSIAALFIVFPKSIIGAMLLLVGIELTKFIFKIKRTEIATMTITATVALITNMAIGFIAAMGVYHLFRRWKPAKKYIS